MYDAAYRAAIWEAVFSIALPLGAFVLWFLVLVKVRDNEDLYEPVFFIGGLLMLILLIPVVAGIYMAMTLDYQAYKNLMPGK